MEKIIEFLTEKYNPNSIIIYGSYQNGTFDKTSDFDCLIITDKKKVSNDTSVVNGVQLDCWIYTNSEVETLSEETFLPIYNSKIVLDKNRFAKKLVEKVKKYVKKNAKKPLSTKLFIKDWTLKTIKRIEKNDDEGNFRAIILFNESLSNYCVLRDKFYFGSKQTISEIKDKDKKGYRLLQKALKTKDNLSIIKWAKHTIAPVFDGELIGETKNK